MSIISKIIGGGGSGLSEAQVDARVVAVVPTIAADVSAKAFRIINLVDDTVAQLDFGKDIFAGHIIISQNIVGDSTAHGIVSFRASAASAFIEPISAGAKLAVSTGVLTNGTSDGTDAALNVSVDTNNIMYFKNRLGGTRTIAVQVFGISADTPAL